MRGLDWLIAPLALVCFAFSVGVIIWFVPAPGLIVVSVFAIALAAYDFALSAFGRHQREDRSRR
jgi:hypothetical protein